MSRAREIADLVGGPTPDIILKTADGAILNLQTSDTTVTDGSVLGAINFTAPNEASGTDALLVGAVIQAEAEGTFAADNNATSIVFKTAASAAAGTASGLMTFTSGGNLIIKDTDTADGSSPTITLQTGDTDIAADDVLGSINFQAPDEGAGTDALLVAAGIQAVSEGDFSSSNNATKLIFLTGASETATSKFEIASDGSINTPTLGTSNVRLGGDAGSSIASGGNFNVFIGDVAGTACTTGDANVGIGFNALKTQSTAGINTAVGFKAGESISSGTQNNLFGSNAGDSLTDADDNVAIGVEALAADTKGSNTVAVGHQALFTQNFSTSTDSNNTAVGFEAGRSSTTGRHNTFLGHKAGRGATTATESVFIGNGAGGVGVATGAHSVGIGTGALDALTSGHSNIGIGRDAGGALTTGHSNTVMGYLAGDALLTSNYCVAIGISALSTEDTGAASTAVGTGALQRAIQPGTADTNNVAVGYVAGTKITAGINNVIIGRAGYNLEDADHNVAIGSFALQNDSVGSRSVAIGGYALQTQDFTTAESVDNVAVGYNAGAAVTTGFKNTIVGAFGYDNLQNGDRNISIGYDTTASGVNDNLAILIGVSITSGGAGTARLGNSGGTATLSLDGSDTSWGAASDSRLKKEVADSTVGLEFIKDLRPVTFKWNAKNAIADSLPQYDANSSDPIYGIGKAHHGFIAQEVKAVIDSHSDVVNGHNLWSEDPDGTQQVSPSALVPMLVKAIQEQNALIVALTARVETLEG